MDYTKQTVRKSTGGKAPMQETARHGTKAARRAFPGSLAITGP